MSNWSNFSLAWGARESLFILASFHPATGHSKYVQLLMVFLLNPIIRSAVALMSVLLLIVAVMIFAWFMLREGFLTVPKSRNQLFGIVPTATRSSPPGLQ